MKLTQRQKMLLEIATRCLDSVGMVIGIEGHHEKLDYDGVEQDLCCLADDIKIEFDLD